LVDALDLGSSVERRVGSSPTWGTITFSPSEFPVMQAAMKVGPAIIFFIKAKMKLIHSRGTRIDTEKCIEQAGGSRFNLVLIATIRARELARKHKEAGYTTQMNAPVSALLEIQESKIGPEYLKKVQ
jgi:DNA-directed RNA polymerase subunit K/omega